MRSIDLLLVLLAFCASINAAEPTKLSASVKEFGAKGDGVTIDTNAIQQAIDSVSSKGGGLVHVPAGKHLTGTVQLKPGKESLGGWMRGRRNHMGRARDRTGLTNKIVTG